MQHSVNGRAAWGPGSWSGWLLAASASLLLAACGATDSITYGQSTSMPNSSLHTVGGAINGLTGSGLVLVNGADHVTIAADATAFTFPTSVAQAASYAVTVQSVPAGLHCSVVNGTGTVATTDVTNVLVACAAQLFSVGGTVSGLSGTGLVLANGADQLTVVAGATTFTLANPVSYSNSYAVTVQSAPAGLTCSVANATGIMGTANVNNVVVTCSDLSYALGGTISGLNGAGLVLANGTDHLTVAAGATTFALGAVAFSSSYAVTVDTQPSGVTCSVTGGMGTMSAGDVTNVAVTCSDQPYSLGGTIAGLDATGLVLANGSDQLTVSLGANSFMLPTPVAFASSYAVTVMTQPTGLTCTVSAGSGAMPAANVSSVSVVCAHQSYTLSGAISGLNGTGLVLANGADRLSVASGAAAFTLPASVAFGSSYAVTVATQPAGVSCTVSSGSGTMPAMNVTSVDVVCSDQTFTLGGTIIGLTASGLVLTDGTDWVSVAANAGVFSMPTGVAYQSHYQVTVVAQPAAGLNCTVTGGSGTMPATDASSVQVTCAPRYWSWQGGSNTANARGIYGTRGIAASGNVPGARLGAAVWNGSATQRWMFAGVGVDGNGNTSDLSDLWSYNQNTNQWTWVGGPTTNGDNGTFGAQGVAALGNLPSSRKNSATWTDGAGTLWLFGGYHDNTGNGYLNDLWSYNPSSGLWTWMSGSNTSNGGNASCTNVNSRGVYGVRGVAAAGNSPGARLSPVTWIDGAGNLWLHGGYGCDAAGTLGNLNDLWSYNPGTNQWTWINGSTTIAASGVYGPQGVAATGNVPGGRQSAVSWQDGAGHFWLFGGNGNDSAGTTGNLNDLWLYDPTTNLWEWVSGSTVVNAYGVYGAQGSAPGARDAAQGWIDSAGHLLLFGGNGQASNGSGGWLNDLWSYDSTANQWTWVSGSSTTNVVGTYGSLSVGAAGNVPGARFQSVGWIDAADHLWLFGGYGRDRTTNDGFQPLNDLFDY